jgi:hypothetical protein
MDLTGSYKISDSYVLYFSAKNLLKTPLRYDYGDSSRPQQIEVLRRDL